MTDPETAHDHHRTCFECERTFPDPLQQVSIHMDLPSGGYDRVPVPLCHRCRGQRFGYDCPQCGLTHDTQDDASFCCRRRQSEAPDCRECDRRMTVVSKGHSPIEGTTVTVAKCECCPVAWGAFTGWFLRDDAEPCKHVETDPRGEAS